MGDTGLRLDEIKRQRREADGLKKDTFDQVLRQAYNKINHHAEMGETFCVFEVPAFVLGGVRYELTECRDYILRALLSDVRKNRLKEAIPYPPNVIYVSWEL